MFPKKNLKLYINSLVVMAFVLMSGMVLFAAVEHIRIQEDLKDEQIEHTENIEKVLEFTNDTILKYMKVSMNILENTPNGGRKIVLGNLVTVGDKVVRDLIVDGVPQANNVSMVEKHTQITHSFASLLVRDGSDFIRIATNVPAPNGMIIGSVLDKKGPVYKEVISGRPYFGIVSILDKYNVYYSGYSPILDSNGEVIGLWYVGYRFDNSIVKVVVNNSKILDDGFIAILDNDDNLLVHSNHVSDDWVRNFMANQNDWTVIKREIGNIKILSAFSNLEVIRSVLHEIVPLAIIVLIVFIGLSALFTYALVCTEKECKTKCIHKLCEFYRNSNRQ